MKQARLHLWVGLLLVCSLACAAVGQVLPQGEKKLTAKTQRTLRNLKNS
jgi:hypothetical protein